MCHCSHQQLRRVLTVSSSPTTTATSAWATRTPTERRAKLKSWFPAPTADALVSLCSTSIKVPCYELSLMYLQLIRNLKFENTFLESRPLWCHKGLWYLSPVSGRFLVRCRQSCSVLLPQNGGLSMLRESWESSWVICMMLLHWRKEWFQNKIWDLFIRK